MNDAEKQLEDELKKEGFHINPKGTPDEVMQDLQKQLFGKLPAIMNDFFKREKRVKLELKLLPDEIMRLMEFMLRDGMGKTQVFESP